MDASAAAKGADEHHHGEALTSAARENLSTAIAGAIGDATDDSPAALAAGHNRTRHNLP